MTVYLEHGVVHVTCGGKPLGDAPYLPPESDLAFLGRYLASKYAAKEPEQVSKKRGKEEI